MDEAKLARARLAGLGDAAAALGAERVGRPASYAGRVIDGGHFPLAAPARHLTVPVSLAAEQVEGAALAVSDDVARVAVVSLGRVAKVGDILACRRVDGEWIATESRRVAKPIDTGPCPPRYAGAFVWGFCWQGLVGATVKLIRNGTFTRRNRPINVVFGSVDGVWGDLDMGGRPPGVVVGQGKTVVGVYPISDGLAKFPLPDPYPDELAKMPHYIQVSAPGYPTRSAPVVVPRCGGFGLNFSLDDESVYPATLTLQLPSGHAITMNRYTSNGGTQVGQFSGYFGTLRMQIFFAWKTCPDPTDNRCWPIPVADVTIAAYFRCGGLGILIPEAVRYQWGEIQGNKNLGYNYGGYGEPYFQNMAVQTGFVNITFDGNGVPIFYFPPNNPNGQPGPRPCGPDYPCVDMYWQATAKPVNAVTTTYMSKALPIVAAGIMGPHSWNPSLMEIIGEGAWTIM